MVAQLIACVTGELFHGQLVISNLAANNECAILGPEPVSCHLLLGVNSQLVASVFGHLVQFLVADPVVAVNCAKTSFELCP